MMISELKPLKIFFQPSPDIVKVICIMIVGQMYEVYSENEALNYRYHKSLQFSKHSFNPKKSKGIEYNTARLTISNDR